MNINRSTKKANLLLICLVACSPLIAQNSQIFDFVRIDLPAKTVKLSKEELKSIVAQGKIDSLMVYPPPDTSHVYYRIDSNLLALYGELRKSPKNYLENRRKDFEALSKLDGMNCNCTSQIKTINNYSVLITCVDSRDCGGYFFYSVNRKRTAVINGSLIYSGPGSNKANASKVLRELLDNLAYKL